MRKVWKIMAAEGGMGRAFALAALVLIAGWGLLALSGWFITAAAVAGLAGVGASFDVFRPGASVRGLAMLRTLARYGERWLGHDATLRAIVGLRRAVLAGLAALPWQQLLRIRRGPALARVIADTDALDGLPLRLLMPLIAAVVAFPVAGVVIGALAGWQIAAAIIATYLAGAAIAAAYGLPRSSRIARRQVAAEEDFQIATLDLIAARDDLAVYGLLHDHRAKALAADDAARMATAALDRVDRMVGLILDLTRGIAAGIALWLGARGVEAGAFGPGMAALCFFSALAMGEFVTPLRRAVQDYGRIDRAAEAIAPLLDASAPTSREATNPLPVEIGTHRIEPGEMLALTGPSGAGKSTLLQRLAGVLPQGGEHITLGGRPLSDWDEDALRQTVTLALQRPALIAGTLRDNLRIADPDADDDRLEAALKAVRLDHLRDGLDLQLRGGGAGLSGGERRRLSLARAILRRPQLLLLDEPAEGLDPDTARAVLAGVRAALPESAIIIATHRIAELPRGIDRIEFR